MAGIARHLLAAALLAGSGASFAQSDGPDLSTAANVTPETPFAQLVVSWGEGAESKRASYTTFHTANGESVWVSVSESNPDRITRVVYWPKPQPGDWGFEWPADGIEVFNLIEETRHRSCDDFQGQDRVNIEQITEKWGPPDGAYGSGFAYLAYALEDGSYLSVRLSGPYVVGGCWDIRGKFERLEQ